ncbi:MAG: GGDEF domain-containing protein [Chromatiaceae bacterium]|nr:MAG: GGDEF domain-containing protein [Chromatiaceae bacterium]
MSSCQTLDHIIAGGHLHALFQPIVDMRNGKVAGYEGLIRGPSDSPWHAPQKLLAEARRQGRLFELDLLCREVILGQFAHLGLEGKLFLNVTPDVLLDRKAIHGVTLRFLKEAGIAPDRVVIELTEQEPIVDYSIMREAVRHYRDMGFSIALDDLGAGYSSLRHWSELQPEYVKIDMHFVQNVDRDDVKRQFLRSINEIAHGLGTRIIAEGIETAEEYEVIRHLGIPFGQGYHIARPAAQPAIALESYRSKRVPGEQGWFPARRSRAEELIRPNPVASPNQTLAETVERFQASPDLHCLPVVDKGKPVGIVRRHELLMLYSQRFTRELHDRSPLRYFMRMDPLQVPADQPLEELSETITRQGQLDQEFLIVDAMTGNYLGMGWLVELLRKLTKLQVHYARYANPLTQLPGNVPINEHLDLLLRGHKPFTVAYCDVDHFKPFNDHYGYARGDRVIRALGDLMRTLPKRQGDFVGHVGGDDFILVFTEEDDWRIQCEQLLEAFAAQVGDFYDAGDRAAGGVALLDRQGKPQFFPLLSLSIGVVPIDPVQFESHLDIAQRASEVKRCAKRQAGNSLFVDRRLSDDPRVKADQAPISRLG